MAIDVDIQPIVAAFHKQLEPLESADELKILMDNRTGARYCECHVQADKLLASANIDAALNPDTQPGYRLNREIVGNQPAFLQMQDDALKHRSFSNIVAEYRPAAGITQPLEILGGQHRYKAIELALQKQVNELHGLKVYFGLDAGQRKDVAEIANANISISAALRDRLVETYRGPAVRDWCHKVGLLLPGQDFGDKPHRGGRLTVNLIRTFIHNFYAGKKVVGEKFKETDTTPFFYRAGRDDEEWENVLDENEGIWDDPALLRAGHEFAKLVAAQRSAFTGKEKSVPRDYPFKATNAAVLAGWAYTAGMLQSRAQKLARHYALSTSKSKGGDPLNADACAQGRHNSDPPNYRGLGNRTDARERAQMVELFYLIADNGESITPTNIKNAIYRWFAKKAELESQRISGSTS